MRSRAQTGLVNAESAELGCVQLQGHGLSIARHSCATVPTLWEVQDTIDNDSGLNCVPDGC